MTITYKMLATVSMLTLTYVIRGVLNDHDELRNYTVKKINKLEQQVKELNEQKGE